VLDEYDGDRMMVAEAWVPAERRPLYLREGEYHQAFDFDLLSSRWDAAQFTAIIDASLRSAAGVGSNATWVLSNHDVVRHAARYGLPTDVEPGLWLLDGPPELLDAERGARRARAAALLTFALPGSVYVYQGDELGLPEAWQLPTEVLQDPIWNDSGHTVKGRDGCRVPIPWEPTGPSLGFGDVEGWLPQPPEFVPLAASAQESDHGSTLRLYQTALALRRERLRSAAGLTWLDAGSDAVAFERSDGVCCVVNMGETPIPLPQGRVLLSSAPFEGDLPPDVAVWLI
jgi:alpha-glucosidase